MKYNYCGDKNIILVSIDCLRADCINIFPNKKLLKKYNLNLDLLKTDTLDKIIGKGTLYTNCFSSSSYTTASHASILTGCYPINHGVQEYFNSELKRDTIFEAVKKTFKDRVSTMLCTDFPFILGKYIGFDRMVDHYVEGDENRALKILQNEAKDKRFIALFHFGNVHTPYGFSSVEADGPAFRKTVRALQEKYKLHPGRRNALEWLEKDRSVAERQLRILYHEALEKMYESEAFSDVMEMYIKGVAYFDQNRFKNFIDSLKATKLLDKSTLIIFSDHGERWGCDSHGHHDNLYDDTVRVPLIIYDPSLQKGICRDDLVRTIDIFPTILELLGLEKDYPIDGASVINLNNNPRAAIGEIWSCEDKNEIKKAMYDTKRKGKLAVMLDEKNRGYLWKEYARTAEWKLINEYTPLGRKKSRFYHISGGLEKENLPIVSIQKELAKLLRDYRKLKNNNSKFRSLKPLDSELLRQELSSLGYNV